MARNYKKERLAESSERKEDRKARGRARYAAIKAGKAKVGDGKVVDHKKPLSKGGSNSKSNTRIQSKAASNKQGGHLAPRSAKVKGGKNSRRGK